MTTKKAALVLSLIVCVAISATAQEKYKLELKPVEGAKYSVVSDNNTLMDISTMGQKMQITNTIGLQMELTYQKLDNGNLRQSSTVTKYDMGMIGMGQSMKVSSDDAQTNEQNKTLKAFVGKAVRCEITPEGKRVGSFDATELIDALESSSPGMGKAMGKAYSENMQITNFYFPEHEVAVGESWECEMGMDVPANENITEVSIKQKVVCTLAEVQEQFYVVKAEGDITTDANGVELKGKQQSTYYLDRATGMVDHAEISANLHGQTSQMGANADFNGTVKGTIKVEMKK
ncbi:MAG: DUF6263 family protein [Porphyromonas sp.]|nr:DUF6263 family protein [Porphyromonas sp.]